MHVIIVGNGFDRNLGFKTGYTNFIKSSYFRLLVYNQNLLARHLQETHNLNNWIDVENEFQQYSENFRSQQIDRPKEKVKNDYIEIKNALMEYLSSINYSKCNENSNAFRLLQQADNSANTVIYDFNYTPTVANLLKNLNKHAIDHKKVHGSLEDKNIVFGVSDHSRIFQEHNFLKKSTTKGFPAISFDETFEQARKISIFGHSLGNMDHDYFRDFFQEIVKTPRRDLHIKIYYKGDSDRDSINDRLIELTNNQLAKFKQNLYCPPEEIEC